MLISSPSAHSSPRRSSTPAQIRTTPSTYHHALQASISRRSRLSEDRSAVNTRTPSASHPAIPSSASRLSDTIATPAWNEGHVTRSTSASAQPPAKRSRLSDSLVTPNWNDERAPTHQPSPLRAQVHSPPVKRLPDNQITPANDDQRQPRHPTIQPTPAKRDYIHLPLPKFTSPSVPPLTLPPPLLSSRPRPGPLLLSPHTTPPLVTPGLTLQRALLSPHWTPRPRSDQRPQSPTESVRRRDSCRDTLETPSRPGPSEPRDLYQAPPPIPAQSGSLLHPHLTSPRPGNGAPQTDPIVPIPTPSPLSGSLIHRHLASPCPESSQPLPTVLQTYARHRSPSDPPTYEAAINPPQKALEDLFSSDLAFKDFRGTRGTAAREFPGPNRGREGLQADQARRDEAKKREERMEEAQKPQAMNADDRSPAKRHRGGGTWKQSVCDICHIKKTKCDRAEPNCQVCLERGYLCHYSEPGEAPVLPADVAAGNFRIPRKGMDTGLHRQGFVTIVSPEDPSERIQIQIPDPHIFSAISNITKTKPGPKPIPATATLLDDTKPMNLSRGDSQVARATVRALVAEREVNQTEATEEARVIFKFWKKRNEDDRKQRVERWRDSVSCSEDEGCSGSEEVPVGE